MYKDEFEEISKATVSVKIDVPKLDWSMSVKIKAEEVRDEQGLSEAIADKLGELMRNARADVAQFNPQMEMFDGDDDDVSARPNASGDETEYEEVKQIGEGQKQLDGDTGFVRQLPEGQ